MFKKMGIVRRLLSLSLSLLIILCLAVIPSYKARAVAVPILPYIPPELVHVIDYIYNSYGVTAPDIPEDVERMKAYVEIYARANNVSEEQAWEDLAAALDQGKTSGYIVISASLNAMINGTLAYSVENGLQYGDSYPVSLTAIQWQERLKNQYNITVPIEIVNRLYSIRRTEGVQGDSFILYAIGVNNSVKGRNTINFSTLATSLGSAGKFQLIGQYYRPTYTNGNYAGVSLAVAHMTCEWDSQTRTVGAIIGDAYGGEAMDSVIEQGTTAAYTGSIATVQAQNTEIGQGLVAGTVYAMSALTQLQEDGTINPTHPVTIPMPAVDTVPATTVAGLSQAQDQNGAVPVVAGTDVASILQALQEAQAAEYGDTQEYALDLTQYFPFCLPFDAGNLLTAFVAEPEAPHISYTIINPFSSNVEDNIVLDIDLSIFDGVAAVLRNLEKILLVIGLCVITRSLYLRG